jgi:phosphatidylinositol alpha-1,6-mannosyltransferase
MKADAPFASVIVTPNIGGADGISTLSREIVAAMPQPAVVLSLHDVDGYVEHAPETAIRGAAGNRVRFCALIAGLLPRSGPETVVICCHLHLAAAARVLATRGARLTTILCGIEAWTPLRPTERWALGGSDLVAISSHTARRFKQVNPSFIDADVTVVHPGLPDIAPSSGEGNGSSRLTALIVGRMAADEGYKGHDALIEVWPRVLERHPNAALVIAGDGNDRARLEGKAAAAGLTRSVIFTGRVDRGELERLYRECRLFVMPSRDEGFGLVFLEAMRAAKPCIAGTGAAEEIIRDGDTGFIIDPTSADQLTNALVRLFAEPDTCAMLGDAGRDRFRRAFTNSAFGDRLTRAVTAAVVRT